MNNKQSLEFSPRSQSFAKVATQQKAQSVRYSSSLRSTRTKIQKDMAKEIKKYRGHIYHFDIVTKQVLPAQWVENLDSYNHFECELHHYVPFTDWEHNTKNVRELVKNNRLILLPKIMHQHLENPLYKLPDMDFERIYGIDPKTLLFDVNRRTDNLEKSLHESGELNIVLRITDSLFLTEEDLSCFDGCEFKTEKYA